MVPWKDKLDLIWVREGLEQDSQLQGLQTLSSAAVSFPTDKCLGGESGVCFKGGFWNSAVTLLTSSTSGEVFSRQF